MDLSLFTKLYIFAAQVLPKDKLNIPNNEVGPDFPKTITNIVFGILGGVALIYLVLSGVKLVLSEGKPEEVNKARNSIVYAAIGLAISVAAFTIVNFVVSSL